jgi:hypothetical protein
MPIMNLIIIGLLVVCLSLVVIYFLNLRLAHLFKKKGNSTQINQNRKANTPIIEERRFEQQQNNYTRVPANNTTYVPMQNRAYNSRAEIRNKIFNNFFNEENEGNESEEKK